MGPLMNGTALVPGRASGKLLWSSDPLSFWGGYDQYLGTIIDERHPLFGESGIGKIIAIPGTRGSSTTTAVLLEAVRLGNQPAGFVVTDRDTFLALASVVAMEMYTETLPVIMVSEEDFLLLKGKGRIEILKDGTIELESA